MITLTMEHIKAMMRLVEDIDDLHTDCLAFGDVDCPECVMLSELPKGLIERIVQNKNYEVSIQS